MDAFQAIKAGLDQWKAYRAIQGANLSNRNANLEGTTFDGYDLSDCDFEQARLINSTFRGAKLIRAKLKGSNFVGSKLDGLYAEDSDFSNVNFNNAILNGAKFVRCEFTGVAFTVNFQNCVFESCVFKNGGFASLTLEDVSFKGSQLFTMNCDRLTGNRVSFEGVHVDASRMEDITLTDSTFTGATIQGTPLSRLKADSTDPNRSSISFEGAKFKGNVNLQQASIPGANFKAATSESLLLFEATVPKADFSKARLQNTNCGRASLTGSNFSGADLSGSSGSDVQFQNSDFTGANLSASQFGKCNFHGCSLRAANLTQCNLQLADLERADLRGAEFYDTRLTGARVNGARITRSDFDDIRLHQYWGLRESQIRGMSVEDDFAKAQMQVGGFWSWYHSIVTLAWLLPLLWIALRSFLLSFMPKSVMSYVSVDISLWGQLWGYILSGKMYARAIPEAPHWTYEFNAFHFATFMLMAAYNVVRVYMLYVVKRNELSYTVTGLQPVYVDEGKNWWLLRFVKYGAYLYSLFTLTHVIRFLGQEYPALVK